MLVLFQAITLFIAITLFAGPGSAAAKQYEIGAYDLQLQLGDDGRYIITERITYDFLEGAFTKANRNVPGTGFKQLRFISVEGEGLPLQSVRFRDGRSLSLDWTYPETTERATFVIKYEAIGGLRSQDGSNVIDWNPVGSDWSVPINNVDVKIRLPNSVQTVHALPLEDVVGEPTADEVRFQRDALPPRTFYHIVVSFPEIISVVTEPPTQYGLWILLGLGSGLLLMVGDIVLYARDRAAPAASGPAPETLSLLEMGVLLFGYDGQRRRGVAATVFALAQAGYICLVVEPKRLGTDQVRAEVSGTPDVGPAERLILDGLRRRGTLQKFAQETGTFQNIIKQTLTDLVHKGIMSKDLQRRQTMTILLGIALLLLATAGFVLFAVGEHPWALSLSILFLLQFVGCTIRGPMMTVLTPEGLYAQGAVKALLDEKLKQVDDLMRYEAPRAWDVLFEELPYLILHHRVTAAKLGTWQKEFRRIDRVQAPAWLDIDPAKTGRALDALSAAQTVHYTFLAVMMTTQSTGASGVSGMTGSVGAAGSGAGGGGGGAG